MSDSKTPALIKRKIREHLRTILLNNTEAGQKVSIGRAIPAETEQLPIINIYTTGEDVRRFDEAPKTYQRSMSLVVECIAAGDNDDDLDIRLEKLGDKVEELVEKDETFGGLLNKIELTGTDYQSESEAQSPIGALILRFTAQFYTDAIRSDCLPNFAGADVVHEVPDGTPANEQEINMEL